MSNKSVNEKDYLYLSSMLRAREAKMISKAALERMVDAPTFDDAAKQLSEFGYPDLSGMSAGEVEKALSDYRAEAFRELENMLPQKELVDVFRIRFDYHNAKVLVKSEGAQISGEHLLSDSGTISKEKLKEEYHSEELLGLPYNLRIALIEALSVLSRTENPQLADFVLDRAYFAQLEEMASDLGLPFLQTYISALADSANLSACVRVRRLDRDAEFLRGALVPGGSRGAETLVAAAQTADGIEDVFKGTAFEEAAKKGVEAMSGGSLTEFELACDNAVISVLGDAKYVGFGPEIAVAYLATIESKITAIRMILTGKLSGVKPEKLRERLRDSYA